MFWHTRRAIKLVSQTYIDETELIESDLQFGVTNALIGKLQLHSDPHQKTGMSVIGIVLSIVILFTKVFPNFQYRRSNKL